MAQVQDGDTVKVHYTGKLADGTVFDSSDGRDPLEFTVGAGQVIPGFDEAVVGMAAGETKSVTIPSAKAYGDRNDDLIAQVERAQLPADLDPKLGDRLQIPQPGGQPLVVEVTDLTDAQITLDGNHPLAGKDLTFEVQLVAVA